MKKIILVLSLVACFNSNAETTIVTSGQDSQIAIFDIKVVENSFFKAYNALKKKCKDIARTYPYHDQILDVTNSNNDGDLFFMNGVCIIPYNQ